MVGALDLTAVDAGAGVGVVLIEVVPRVGTGGITIFAASTEADDLAATFLPDLLARLATFFFGGAFLVATDLLTLFLLALFLLALFLLADF